LFILDNPNFAVAQPPRKSTRSLRPQLAIAVLIARG
jgi:hypothetical protein